MNEWISVEERLPESNTSVLVMNAECVDLAYLHCKRWQQVHGSLQFTKVTHWQPLPPPPVKKRWMPKVGEIYYAIDSAGNIVSPNYDPTRLCSEIRKYTGCFKTIAEAEAMLEKIKALVTEEIGSV
jgi:hypothetical protein